MVKKSKESEKKDTNKKGETKKEEICFVIAPIGKPDSEIRRRSDQVFNHVVKSTVEPLGYKPVRADHISEPGLITSQVIQHVVDSPLVIADLTGRNPNVFYELAIRHAIKRPLIQLIQMGEQIPFDVAGTRTIQIDIHDLDKVEEAKKELIKQIRSITKGKSEIDTPISVALDLKILRESENPEKRSLADVVGVISELRSTVLSIEEKIANPQSLIPPEYLEWILERRMSWPKDLRRELDLLGHAHDLIDKKRVSAKDKEELIELLRYLMSRISRRMRERS